MLYANQRREREKKVRNPDFVLSHFFTVWYGTFLRTINCRKEGQATVANKKVPDFVNMRIQLKRSKKSLYSICSVLYFFSFFYIHPASCWSKRKGRPANWSTGADPKYKTETQAQCKQSKFATVVHRPAPRRCACWATDIGGRLSTLPRRLPK